MPPQAAVRIQPAHEHRSRPAPEAAHRALDGLRVIALFKFVKAVLLIATSYGEHLLLNGTRLARLYGWVDMLTDSFAQRMLLRALTWVGGLGATRIHIVIAVTLGYTAVVLTEGIGLWMRRAWAEWFTVIATASLIPFELWELVTRAPNRRLAVLLTLLINVAVVWYLVWLLRRTSLRHAHSAQQR